MKRYTPLFAAPVIVAPTAGPSDRLAAFANDRDRDALLSAGGPQLSKKYRHLFTSPPTFDKVDLLEARITSQLTA